MSYLFSFNTAPPSGFIIDPQTGLITIADDTAPFSGDLSVAVFDGVTIDIKTISIVLSAPDETPLLSAESLALSVGGGRMVPVNVPFIPIAYHGGGRMVPSMITATVRAAILNGGQARTIGLIQFMPTIAAILNGGQARTVPSIILAPVRAGIARGGQARTIGAIGALAITIQQGASLTMAAGTSTTLNAQITIGGSTAGVGQAVTWAIVSGPYSGYGSISSAGVLAVTNGVYQATGAVFVVRATSVSNSSLTTTINVYAIDKFTGIQVTPSASSSVGGDVITINSLLQGIGSDLNASQVSLISVSVSQDGTAPVSLSGNSVTYTASSLAGTININATFFYAIGNYQIQGSASVQNAGTPTIGFTLVPSYTVTYTGDRQYASLDWNSLNDASWATGVATGTFYTSKGDCSIVVDLGSAKTIKKIALAGGYLGGAWGDFIAYCLNGGFMEYSNDGSTWTSYVTISGVTDTTGDYRQYILSITARYWRIRRTLYVATSAFMFYT